MPTAVLTLSEAAKFNPETDCDIIRRAVVAGMECEDMPLDETHISVRFSDGYRAYMLADIEIEVFGQSYESRLKDRDARANRIARMISSALNVECACWINLGDVGYTRITQSGDQFNSTGPLYEG